jgi:hypothetical protein
VRTNKCEGQKERLNLYEVHAREKAGMPEEWKVFRWECFPKSGQEETIYVEVTGAVALIKYQSGPRKGKTNWSKCSSRKTVVLPVEAHKQWCDEWERRTGLCQECTGTGELLKRVSVKDGVEYRPCGKCRGTGKAPSVLGSPESDTTSSIP